MLKATPLILASQSPRRKHLLELAEIPFKIVVEETDESYPANLTLQEVVIHIAKNKALAVKKKHNISTTILAADTIVVLNNQIIGKPKDRTHAIEILSSLSGRKHSVITGVVILNSDYQNCFSETTEVEFYTLTPSQIIFYVDKYKPYDKAGAYAIQEWIGVVGIKSIEGDFYNVMGLPISRVVQALANIS
jgi:septum formation protein